MIYQKDINVNIDQIRQRLAERAMMPQTPSQPPSMAPQTRGK